MAGASVSPFKGKDMPVNFVTNGLGCDHGFRRAAPLPKIGEWTRFGSKIEINGEVIPPPVWKRPGLEIGEILPQMKSWELHASDEEPYTDQEYFLREPTPVMLKKGWNHVKLTLPMTEKVGGWWSHQWIGTFAPVAGTTDHPHEVEGLEYSVVPRSVEVN